MLDSKNNYFKTVVTDEYILDFKSNTITVKESGFKCKASWDVLDYIKRDYWKRCRDDYEFFKRMCSYEADLKEGDGLKLKDVLKDENREIEYGIEEYLIGLTPLQKDVIKLIYERGMKLKEIARARKTSPENISNIKKKAFCKIKKNLANDEYLKENEIEL